MKGPHSYLVFAGILGLGLLNFGACKKSSPSGDDSTPTPTAVANPKFGKHVYSPILKVSCVAALCHGAGGNPPDTTLDMSTKAMAHAQLVGVAPEDGTCAKPARVQAFSASNSMLRSVLGSSCGATGRMPKNQEALHPNHITTIKNWINNGALND